MIYFISAKNSALLLRSLGIEKKNAWVEILPKIPKGFSFFANDRVYLDITGLKSGTAGRIFKLLQESGIFWGILDPKGEAIDPALFFFKGARDYIGKDLIKKGLTRRRFSAAFETMNRGEETAANPEADTAKKKILQIFPGKFAGWKSIRTGTRESFYFLFVSLSGKSDNHTLAGENIFNSVKEKLPDVLHHYFAEADALLWMEMDESFLFLVPPAIASVRAAIEGVLKLIINSRLIGSEKLGLEMPVEFIMALHYGKTIFQAPGKTGTVVSDSVNYIFHLGTRRAKSGRLTVSEDVPELAIPGGLLDLFVSAGTFEGITLRHSKRFTCQAD